MRVGDIIGFREDLFFEGAVQIDWFYNKEKSTKVANSFVFHGSEYFGISEEQTGKKLIDTVSFVTLIAKKIYDDQRGNPFTLAIAGYGTGKSHLAVTMAQIFSGKNYMPELNNKIIDNVRRIDKESAKILENISEHPNLVLTLNGMRDFNLHYELLRSAGRSLRLYGYSDENLKKLNRAHETAFRFLERNIDTNIMMFEQKANELGWIDKGKALKDKLRTYLSEDEKAFNIINAVYEEINGHEIRWDEGVSAIAVLETLIAEYCGISGVFNKIIIIFDEFGRYLEYASAATSAYSGDSALQQIFEAVQNADGNIQMINFIQSDIKTYLQRVDKTSNISRYIGRYDASDKYYLSSNLETVFANLIDRKDKIVFNNTIKKWQKECEDLWVDIYSKMDRWLALKGLWKDQKLFRQVVVEGIYPLHPVSTYMLTGLSDYLQNRSSLTLINRYITEVSSYEIIDGFMCSLILPEKLLIGDLYVEMLSAEQEGRQLSRHCIRFDNILRKFNDKLSEEMLKVLRANLVLKMLRFRTNSYDDVKNALSICSGVSISSLENTLNLLENEYAVLGFDEHTSTFDFLEDSSGAHDFRTFYRRIRAEQKLSQTIFDNSSIRELSGVLIPLNTNFATENKIKTNEWQFSQDLFPIVELTEAFIDSIIADFKNSTAPEKIKGKVIWLYVNKDTDGFYLDKARELSEKTMSIPIVMFLLNDTENKLYNALLEYDVLTNVITDTEKEKYGKHFLDALVQSENVLKDMFDMLKRERRMVTPLGIKALSSRLAVSLSEILSGIFPYIVSFDFDGFDSKQPSRAKKSYCSILKLLLSGSINANTIQSAPIEVRNRFEATLFETGKNSWRCINSNYQITPPKNSYVEFVYTYLEKKLIDNKKLACKDIFEELCMPPYGFNDYMVVYIIAVLCANLSYCIRAMLKKETFSINKWKDSIIGDNKIDIAALKETLFIIVDAGEIVDKYLRLFKKVDSNDDIKMVTKYSEELKQLFSMEEVPTELETQYRLCEYRLNEGLSILSMWNRNYDDILGKYNEVRETNDVYMALKVIEQIESSATYSMFNDKYRISDNLREQLSNIKSNLKKFLNTGLIPWIKEQRCHSVESMSQYRKHYKRIVALLEGLCYFDEAKIAESHGEKELQSREDIRDRQELKLNCGKFMSEKNVTKFIAYTTLIEWEKQGIDLLTTINKHKDFLGQEANKLHEKISVRVAEIVSAYQRIKADMDDIWEDIYDLADIDAVEEIIERIDFICKKGIPTSDRDDFIALKKILCDFIDDMKELSSLKFDRASFENKLIKLYEKYSDENREIDVIHILDAIANEIRVSMDEMEKQWVTNFIVDFLRDLTRPKALDWLDKTINLPAYITEDTRMQYIKAKKVVEDFLSDANIEDVIFYFNKLNSDERIMCMKKMIKILNLVNPLKDN